MSGLYVSVSNDAEILEQIEEKKKELVRRDFSQQLTLEPKRANKSLQAQLESKVKDAEPKQ